MLIAAVMCVHLTAPSLFAQHLEIEESISQHNIPKRTIESPAESSSTTSYIPKGYRGMVEMAHGVGTHGPNYQFKLSTTHGWQFNPYLYLGGFVSFGTSETQAYDNRFNLRFGADFRGYIPINKVAPYLGLQMGYDHFGPIPPKKYLDDEPGGYLGVQLGIRFAKKDRRALNFAIQVAPEFDGHEILFKLGYEF